MATAEEKLLLPLQPPPPVVSPPKSAMFDGPMRLNDLLVNEVEEATQIETVTVTTTTSTESTATVPIAETACSYFDEEQDVLKTPPVRYRGRSPLTKSQSTDAQLSDRDSASIGSADSNHHQSKLQTLLDKAKAKGKKLVHRKKRKSESSTADVDVIDEVVQVNMDVGTEQMAVRYRMNSTVDAPECPAINAAVVRTVPPSALRPKSGVRKIPFFKFRLAVAALMVVGTIFLPFFVSGFFWGVYLCTVAFLYAFVSKPIEIPQGRLPEEEVQEVVQEMNRQNNLDMQVIYKGWMNELKGRYDPGTYHPNQTRSVLVRLDGKYLRVARPGRNVIKYSYYKDPTATQPEPTMIGQSLYDLTNAEVTLRPKGLAPKRWWVRKYPICIRLASKASEITTVTTEKRNRRVSKNSERNDPPINDESESSAYEDESSDERTARKAAARKCVAPLP
uniref:Uncharacterized protein n=1 Tax=Plectus sambesii TaxID=2011161 RepID=A0A914WVZ0_9BILA